METGNGSETIEILPLEFDYRIVTGATPLHGIAIGLSLDPAQIDPCDLPDDVPPRDSGRGDAEPPPEWDDKYAK